MKFTIEQADFERALAAVGPALGRKSTIPILDCVHLEAAGDSLAIIADNLNVRIKTTAPAMVETPGRACIDGRRLGGIVKTTDPGAQIEISVGKKFASATLRTGKARFRIPALPADDFPTEHTSKAAPMAVEAAEFHRCLKAVSYAVSREEVRYYLNGVYLAAEDGTLFFVATDGHRIAHAWTPAPEGAKNWPPVILPFAVLGAFSAALDGAAEAELTLTKTRVALQTSVVRITSGLVDAPYPDWRRVILAEHTTKAALPAAALAAAVRRVALAAPGEKKTTAVHLAATAGRLEVSTVNRSTGAAARDEIAAEIDGHDFTVSLNADYLIDALAHITNGKVTLAFAEDGTPISLIDPAADARHDIMPYRLDPPRPEDFTDD